MGWYYVMTQDIRETLEGKEADVFAVIQGFSQEGQGCFYGSLAKLSSYCGIKSKTTTQNILKSLVEKGAIIKGEEVRNGVKFCSYTINQNWYTISKIDMGGISKIDTNNKEDININNTLSHKGQGRFQKPTLEEVRTFCQEQRLSVDPESFINHYEGNGWMIGKAHMKDWKATIKNWQRREEKERKVAPKERKKESVFEHNLKVMDQMYGTNLHEQAYGRQEASYDEQ